MSWDGFDLDGIDDNVVKRERAKARDLRRSNWWKSKIGQGCCYYCGQQVGGGELTMDHIVPLSRGGKSTKANLVPTCKSCNNKKKTMLPLEWEEYMENIDSMK
ncbi:MAG: HNH endonuclease [Proteobacteria bacterium]|nr:HNH endonuclease [Pseudomonadota bacterium]MBU1714861.1 HNH endonuclease [Pseudomonadota bacterium]